MRYGCFSVLWLTLAVTAVAAQNSSTQTFPLPKSHPWNPKATQVCSSVGRVGIRQAKETPDPSEYLLVDAGRGENRLEITVGEKDVLVGVDGAKPEKYKVAANTTGVLAAVSIGEIEATVSTISIDKVTSYVIWSTTDPRDFSRDVPRHAAVLFACSSASQP
jgi:hypothetical protein